MTTLSVKPMLASAKRRGAALETERRVRLFKNGRHQVLRIPREFELPDEAFIHKKGERLIVESARRKPGLLELLATMEPLDEDFPEIDDPPPTDDDIGL